jgi:hypothetical protein
MNFQNRKNFRNEFYCSVIIVYFAIHSLIHLERVPVWHRMCLAHGNPLEMPAFSQQEI